MPSGQQSRRWTDNFWAGQLKYYSGCVSNGFLVRVDQYDRGHRGENAQQTAKSPC